MKVWTLQNVAWPDMKQIRDEKRSRRVCINGPADGSPVGRRGVTHGPVVRHGKCQGCLNVHAGRPRDGEPVQPKRRRRERIPGEAPIRTIRARRRIDGTFVTLPATNMLDS